MRFLDKTFNLAAAFKWGMLGIVVGIFSGGAVILLFKDHESGFTLATAILLPAIALALYGAARPPGRTPPSKGLQGWIRFTEKLSWLSAMGGRVPASDQIIPDQITIREFLIWTLILIGIIILFIKFPALKTWFSGV